MSLSEKYELINKNNDYKSNNLLNDILKFKGVENPDKYLNLSRDDTYSYKNLDNIDKAVECLIRHIEEGNAIYIQVDNDTDGITSSAALYNYLKRSCDNTIYYNMQKGKGHGVELETIPETVKLVIIPDAGSNQIEEHKELKEKNIDVIVLDHHICDIKSEYVIIVNNQLSEKYCNKDLSGVGVVYKFLQALDEELWQDFADDYLDLVALGNIADMMDIKSCETKYYIDEGLRNIKNEMFKELIYKQSYSMGGKVNINNIAFYIAPCINSLIRCGTQEDKIMLFEAFANIDIDRKFTYKSKKKETKGDIVEENLYEHMARICTNSKSRQNRMKEKYRKEIIENIKKYNLQNNKIIIYNATNKIDKNMTGLMAMDIANIYNRPCLMLRKSKKDLFAGSGRNVDSYEIPSLKKFLQHTNLIKDVQGHDNAHGIRIFKSNIRGLIKEANNQLKDIRFKKGIDFKIPFDELTDDFILIVDGMRDLWGQGLKESLIYIENVYVNKEDIKLIGKNKNTISFTTEDINFIKFFENEETYNNLVKGENTKTIIDIIGTCGVNVYNGNESFQIKIKDFEIRSI